MARGKKGIDGVDKVIDLFPASSAKKIERVLLRAADRDARAAGRQLKAALGSAGGAGRSTRRIATRLAGELGKALHHRGDVGGNRASIRQKAPDSGGRPFHFAHSVVTKADAPAPAGGAPTGGKSKAGRAAAHMRYIEREVAVERLYATGLDVAERGKGLDARGRDDGSWDRDPGRGSPDMKSKSAGPGQAYIENPVKLESGERVLFSFGTIGDTFDERVAFWDALEAAEAHPSARVQHRLIVELPHEASAEARYEMMRTFCARFEADGIPYWAALHAPGEKNDARNFHAHIVYSERPAIKMVDPATGTEAWDFSIVTTYKKKSRNTISTRPHRQDKLREFNDRRFIPKLRTEFAEIVTAVLDRDVVKDATGSPVRYDARSYKDMGVDAVPMKAINRIVADKMKDGKATVLDADYTKRSTAAELRDAAAKRDKDVMSLIALDDALRASAATRRPQDRNEGLPRDMRISAFAMVTGPMIRTAGRRLMQARYEALQVDVMERATVASLQKIVAATSPKAVAAARRVKDPARLAAAPSVDAAKMLHEAALEEIVAATSPKAVAAARRVKDPARLAAAPSVDATKMLHEAALEELAETRRSSAQARRTVQYRIGIALNAWKTMVGADLLGTPRSTPSIMHETAPRARSATNDHRSATAVANRGDRDVGAGQADRTIFKTSRPSPPSRGGDASRSRQSDSPSSQPARAGSKTAETPSTTAPAANEPATGRPSDGRRPPPQGSAATHPTSPRAQNDGPAAEASPQGPDAAAAEKTKEHKQPKPLTMEGALKFRTMSESIDEASRQASAARNAAAAEGPPILVTRAQAATFSRLPSPNDLAEASKVVTGWIKTIRDSEPDPEKRLDRVKAFMQGIIEGLKPMRAAEQMTKAQSQTAQAPQDRPPVGQAPIVPTSAQEAPRARPPITPSARASTDKTPVVESTDAQKMVKANNQLPTIRPDEPAPQQQPPKTAPSVAPSAAGDAIEHPDDLTRRLKREMELKRKKQKRKAVLGRKNKVPTR